MAITEWVRANVHSGSCGAAADKHVRLCRALPSFFFRVPAHLPCLGDSQTRLNSCDRAGAPRATQSEPEFSLRSLRNLEFVPDDKLGFVVVLYRQTSVIPEVK